MAAPPIPGAVKAALPEILSPQLATLISEMPPKGEWIYEIKLDGYRLMTRFEKGKPHLITRGGHDWSARIHGLTKELQTIGVRSGWLDGEIVILSDGVPDFNALQNAFDTKSSGSIVYFLFDLPFLEGYDLRGVPLRHRKQLLASLLKDKTTNHIRFSEGFENDPKSLLASACRMGLEGIIAKRADAPYVSRRTDTWLKLKCKQRQEFVVCGYTDRTRGPGQVGSLILGVYDAAGDLIPAGSVGTGWSADEARALKTKLMKLVRDTPPFRNGPKKLGRWTMRRPGSERWAEPRLVAEVEFAGWTPEGQIRHASFVALRTDKPAKAVKREFARGADR